MDTVTWNASGPTIDPEPARQKRVCQPGTAATGVWVLEQASPATQDQHRLPTAVGHAPARQLRQARRLAEKNPAQLPCGGSTTFGV
jgi:hypothetical protein